MQSRNEMGEIEQQRRRQQQSFVAEDIPVYSVNQNHQYNYEHQQQFFQPSTQDFFHYQHHFQALLQQQQQQQQYQEQQRKLLEDQQSVVASVPCLPLNFKTDLNQNSIKNVVFIDGIDPLLCGSEQNVPETRHTALTISHCCQNQEDSAIRQPFWKPDSDLSERRRNKPSSEKKDREERLEMNQNKGYPYSEQIENSSLEGKSRLFGELEAICRNATMAKTNQTAGSGSSLTGENLAASACLPLMTLGESNHPTNGDAMDVAAARLGHDRGSQTSTGDEEPSTMVHESKKRKKTKDDQMGKMADLFERLVKQLMDHQEVLYRRFVEMIERLDNERKEREEAWRRQELEKLQQETAAKARERALASSREASIVAYLEKITGRSINLPLSSEPPLDQPQPANSPAIINEISSCNKRRNVDNVKSMSKRWPKPEVEALIQIRGRLEPKFQEPGPKGPLWEEISNSMALMGFQRNPKRCKEKWDNINKYFKQSKENSRERPQKLKTCQYFHQLDQLYTKSVLDSCYSYNSSSDHHQVVMHHGTPPPEEKDNDNIENPKGQNIHSGNFRETEFNAPYMGSNGYSYEKLMEELHQGSHTKGCNDSEVKEGGGEDISEVEEEEDGEGDSTDEVE